MDRRLQRIPPVVHWCRACDEYLNIPVDDDGFGHRLGECPYCGVMLWDTGIGAKGGSAETDGKGETRKLGN